MSAATGEHKAVMETHGGGDCQYKGCPGDGAQGNRGNPAAAAVGGMGGSYGGNRWMKPRRKGAGGAQELEHGW